MDAQTRTLGFRLSRRTCCVIAAITAVLAVGLARAAEPARAAAPEKTDILFVFDTSGSMGGVIEEAKEEIKTLVASTEASLPNVEFGVADVEDIPGYFDGELTETKTEEEYEEDNEKAWALWQPLTSSENAVEEAINNLSGEEVAHYGGDGPEAYGRALYESASNPRVGWRSGARHEIVMIADNVPHTPNVNEGIPEEFWLQNPFDTFEEPEGKWGIPGTVWKPGESLEFHKTLQKLDNEEKPLAMVDYFHTEYESEDENYIHYWEYWAAATGGQAIRVNEGSKSLGEKLAQIIKESAEGIPPCAPGYERTPTTPCKLKAPEKPAPAPAPIVPPPPPPPIKLPAPVLGKTVNIEPVSGKVFISLPTTGHMSLAAPLQTASESLSKGLKFIPLTEARQVPVGSTLETTAGVARITTATSTVGKTQSGEFGAGIFKLLQNRKQKGLTELNIVDNRSSKQVCATVGKKAAVAAKLSSKTLGRLTGSAHGKFTTKGQYSAATVRGTSWGVTNQCDGTLTKVSRGEVSVRDFHRRKTITLFSGQSYLAKAPL